MGVLHLPVLASFLFAEILQFHCYDAGDIALSSNGYIAPVDTGINAAGLDYLLFSVKACESASITLAPNKGSIFGPFITLGATFNSEHTIWRCLSCVITKTPATSENKLSCTEYKTYWLTWDTHQEITVGYGWTVGLNTILTDKYPSNTYVRWVTASSYGKADWLFPPVQECHEPLVWSANNSVTSLAGLQPDGLRNILKANLSESLSFSCKRNTADCWYEVRFEVLMTIHKIASSVLGKEIWGVLSFYFLYQDELNMEGFRIYRDNENQFKVFSSSITNLIYSKLDPPVEAFTVRFVTRTLNALALFKFEMFGCKSGSYPKMMHYVGIKSGGVMDYQMTSNIVTISNAGYYPPWRARLDNSAPLVREYPYWDGGTKPGNWIQIDLMVMYQITGFVIQGHEKKHLFMRKCQITYSFGDPMIFTVYENTTGGAIIDAGVSANTPNHIDLDPVIEAQIIRITVVDLTGQAYLKLDLAGRPLDCPTVDSSELLVSATTCDCYFGEASVCVALDPIIYVNFSTVYHVTGIEFEFGEPVNGVEFSVMYFTGQNWVITSATNNRTNNSIQVVLPHLLTTTALQMNLSGITDGICSSLKIQACKGKACPPGYVQNEQSCYRPIKHNINIWDWKSNQTCARSHWQDVAHHVTITSLAEHSLAVGLAVALGVASGPFIGLFRVSDLPDPFVTGPKPKYTWRWVTGENSTLATFWDTFAKQPEEGLGETASRLYSTSSRPLWHDETQPFKTSYICENAATGLLDPLPRWTMFRNAELIISPEAGVAVISETYYLNNCLHACQHTSVIKCTAVVYAHVSNTCTMYSATRNTPGASLKTTKYVTYFELYQDNQEATPLIFTSQGNTQRYVQLSASSHVTDFTPERAWLYDDFAWTATSLNKEWFTVDFGKQVTINYIVLAGGTSTKLCYISSFNILYSHNRRHWWKVMDGYGKSKVFKGNADPVTEIRTYFRPPLKTTAIQIKPVSSVTASCLRIEAFGTILSNTTGCHVSLSAFASNDGDKNGYIRLNNELVYIAPPGANAMVLTTVDTSTSPLMCLHTAPVSFQTGTEVNATSDMIAYVNNVTDGLWIVGISCGSVSEYLLPAYDYFSQELGVDLSILRKGGKIAFVCRKGDPFAAEQRHYISATASIIMETDIRIGYDLSVSPLGVYSNHISLSQLSTPSSSPRLIVRLYSFSYYSYHPKWTSLSCAPGPIIVNLGLEHFITGVLLVTGEGTLWLASDIEISFSDDGVIWRKEYNEDGVVKKFVPARNGEDPFIIPLTPQRRGKFMSLEITSCQNGASLSFEIYGYPSVQPDIDELMMSDLRVSEWNDIPKYGSLVVPNIEADVAGNINVKLSATDCALNTSSCLRWCIGQRPFKVDFGHYYHLTGMKVNGIDINDKLLPFKVLFRRESSWANAEKYQHQSSTDNTTYLRFSPDIRTGNIVLIGIDKRYVGRCLSMSLFGKKLQACPPQSALFGSKCFVVADRLSPFKVDECPSICSEFDWLQPGMIASPQNFEQTNFLIGLIIANALGTSARIDGIRGHSGYEYVNGSGKIPFIPWKINSGDKKYVQLDTLSSGAFTDDSPGSSGLLCETPAAVNELEPALTWDYLHQTTIVDPDALQLTSLYGVEYCLDLCISNASLAEFCTSVSYAKDLCYFHKKPLDETPNSDILEQKTFSTFVKVTCRDCCMPLLRKNLGTGFVKIASSKPCQLSNLLLYSNVQDTAKCLYQPTGSSEWVKVTFARSMKVTGITTHGKLRDYNLLYEDIYGDLRYVKDKTGGNRIYLSSADSTKLFTYRLSRPIYGKTFLINPITLNGFIHLEIYGCPVIDMDYIQVCQKKTPEDIHTERVLNNTILECIDDWTIVMYSHGNVEAWNVSEEFYQAGFGNVTHEYWLGTDVLTRLTKVHAFAVRVDLWSPDEGYMYAEYDRILISNDDVILYKLRNSSTPRVVSIPTSEVHRIGSFVLENPDNCGMIFTNKWLEQNFTSISCFVPLFLVKDTTMFWPLENKKFASITKAILRIRPHPETENIARNKPTEQSSRIDNTTDAIFAVDGNIVSGCAITKNDITRSWWLVDLQQSYPVAILKISNCCGNITMEYQVMVGSSYTRDKTVFSSEYTECGRRIDDLVDGDQTTLRCEQAIKGQYVVIQKLDNEPLKLCEVEIFAEESKGLNEACLWNQDCLTRYSECSLVESTEWGPENGMTCQCRLNYIQLDDGCIPMVDVSVIIQGVILLDSTRIIRNQTTWADIRFSITNEFGSPIPEAKHPDMNFNITAFYVSSGFQLNRSETSYLTSLEILDSTMNLNTSLDINQTLSVAAKIDVTVPATICHNVTDICIVVEAAKNLTYHEIDLANNIDCYGISEIITCSPDIDISIVDVQYLDAIPITRDLPGRHNFSAVIANPSDYDIISLEGEHLYNFELQYFFSAEIPPDIHSIMRNGNEPSVSRELFQVGITKSTTSGLPFTVNVNVNITICETLGFICVAIHDLPLASWNESDPDNNVMCFDVKEHITCHPELKIALTEVTSTSTVVRNYNSAFVVKLYISNTNDTVPVSQLSGTRTNYDIEIFLRSTSNSYGRLDFILKYLPVDENQKGLASGATTSITADFMAFVSKAVCQAYTELCVEIKPAKESSYLSPVSYTGNRLCYNATKYIQCFVPPIEGVSFTASEWLVLKGSSVDLNISWTKGIEVQYNVSELTPVTGFSFSWNWQEELQVPSLGHTSMIKYTCLYAGNVTLELVIWNDASSFTKLLNITIEPDLTLAMSLGVVYTPNATPLDVTFTISPLSDIPEVLFWCYIEYGDDNSTDRMFTLRTTTLVHVHTYVTDCPDALFSVLCRNRLTNVSFQEEIILRQEIEGLTITPISDYNVAWGTVIFSISLTKGSHVRYNVSFGDDSVENVTVPQRLSSLSPYLVQHIYTDYDNYTVRVDAWNEHFRESTYKLLTIHWLCYVPEIRIPFQYTDMNSPFQIRKSKSVDIEPDILINCTSSTSYNTSWKIRTPSDKELFSLHSMDYLHLKPRTLDYGMYIITFSLSMFSSKPLPEGDERMKILNLYLEIVKSPLKVSIEHGKEYGSKFNTSYVIKAESVTYDPDLEDPEDKSGMRFRWFCRRIDEEFQFLANGQVNPQPYKPPPDQIRHPYLGYGGCFKLGPGIIATSGGSYSFNTGDMIGMTKYLFRVEVFKDVRWGFFEQAFYVGPRDPPQASIVCLQNCEAKTSIFTEKIVKSVCEAKCGDDPNSMNVVWELYHIIDDDTEVEVPGLANKTRTGIDKPKLFLDLSSLAQGQWYKLVALNSVIGSPNSTLSLVFLLNKLASSGTCSIEPKRGIATETKFVASCEGWKEWNPLVPGGSLRYEYRVKTYGSETRFLFYYGTNSTSMPVDLPLGHGEYDMMNLIEFAIIDGINDPVIIEQNVSVVPRKENILVTLSLLLSTISDPESFLAAATESGNFVAYLSYLYSISSITNIPISHMLNSTSNETEQRQLKRIKEDIRKQITLILQKIPVIGPSSLSQINDVLRSSLGIRDELNMDSLALAMNTTSLLTSSFVAFSANSSLGAATLRYVNDITTSAITVMETGAYTDDSPSRDDENVTSEATTNSQPNAKLKDIMKQGMSNLDILANSLIDLLEMGDPVPVFKFDSATLLVGKSDVSKLTGSRISTGHGQLKYPQQIKISDSNRCAAQKVLFLGFNPYIWSSEQQESNVDSSVLSLDVSACNHTDVTTERARNKRSLSAEDPEDQQLEVELNVATTQPECFNRTISTKEMIYHVVEGSTKAQPVKVLVQLMENSSHSIDIYIGYGSKPTFTHYDLKSRLRVPMNGDFNGTEYLQFISAENLTSTSSGLPLDLYVGLLPRDQEPTCDDSICDYITLDYCMLLEFISCQMWDDDNDVWITDICKVDTIAKDTVKFKSNLFGNFGAGLFVPPNTIDFSTVFDDFGAKLIENLPVFMTVLTVIVLYIPLVIICRRYDKKDKLRWQCLPLVDNFMEDEIQYELHVLTGLKKNASCASNVSFILYGSENDTGIRKMSDGCRQNFTRGNVASFTMMTPWSLGEPVVLKIWHDNSGKGALASWFLSKVVVVDVEKKKWYLFTCNTWLGGSNPAEAIFTVDTDSRNNNNLLQSNMARKLFEDHIWLSVVYRLSWSAFTRVQRLSCCLAVLFLTMVMNAMWYKTEEGGSGSSVIHIGPISFSVHELYTGTVSSLIIVPPIVLVTTLFVKSMPPKKEMETGRFILEKRRKRLPHWCQYIAWFLTVLAIAVGAFFTILYSFQFGGEKSKKWLIAFLLGFFESVFLIQPTKVMIVAVLLSFIMKKDSAVSQFEELLGKNEVPKAGIITANPEAFTLNTALGEEELKSLQHEREKEVKAQILVKEVIYYTVFILFLACVIYTNQDRNTYLQKENIMNIFFRGIPEVINRDAFWSWAEESVVPHLYLTDYYNNKPAPDYDQRFITNTYSLRVGPPRLRQVRKKSEVCHGSIYQGLSQMFCTLPYSIANEDRTTYSLRWHSFTNDSNDDVISNSFQYRTSQELNGTTYWGSRHYYSGGGYVANLGNTKAEASTVITELKNYEWIDDYTAAVFVEFSLYNANTGLFSLVIIAVEFEAGAAVTSHTTIDSVQLYRYNGANGVFSLLTEISCLIFILVITVMEARRLIREKCRYFNNGWNWIQRFTILFFLIAMSMYAVRSVMTQALITVMMNNRESITNFQPITTYNGYFLLFLGVVSFLVHIQMLHVLRYVKSIALMTTALSSAMKDMLGLGYATILLLFSFTATMALCFREVEGYESFYAALGSSLSSMMQKFDFYAVTDVTGLAGGGLLLVFVMVMKILVINFLISMLNETLLAIKEDREKWAKGTEVIEYLKRMVITMIKGNDSTTECNPVYHEEDTQYSPDDLLDRIDILEQLVLAYDGPPRAVITADLVDYFLHFQEEEMTSNASELSLPLHDGVSLDSGTGSDMDINDVHVTVGEVDINNAQRLVEAFCQLFGMK